MRYDPTGSINAAELRRDLSVFAADSLQGREAGTEGELKAVRFIESRLRQLGLRPAGESGYVQRVPLVRQRFSRATRFVVTNRTQQQPIPLGEQLVPLLQLGPGAPLPRLDAEGEIVFASYGVTLPALERDDLGRRGVAAGGAGRAVARGVVEHEHLGVERQRLALGRDRVQAAQEQLALLRVHDTEGDLDRHGPPIVTRRARRRRRPIRLHAAV